MDNLSQDIEQILDKLEIKSTRMPMPGPAYAAPTLISVGGKAEATSALTQLFNKRLIEELEAMKFEHPVDSPEHLYIMSWFDRHIAQLKGAK